MSKTFPRMRTTILLALLPALIAPAMAQPDSTTAAQGAANGDTTAQKSTFRIETKRKQITVTTEPKAWASSADSIAEALREHRRERRNLFTYWAGVDAGVNTLLDPGGRTELGGDAANFRIDNGRSRFVSLNFMEQKIEFGSHHAGLLTGLGWEFVNYHFRNNVLLAYDKDTVTATAVELPDLRKNKLRQMGLRVPLLLEFNTKRAPLPTADDLRAMRADTTGALARRFAHSRKRNVHIAFGVVGSWYFDTMYKRRWVEEGATRRLRDKGDHNLLPYRAAASAHMGYGSLNLFAEYALTPLFKDGKGPELTPLTVGLTLVGFN